MGIDWEDILGVEGEGLGDAYDDWIDYGDEDVYYSDDYNDYDDYDELVDDGDEDGFLYSREDEINEEKFSENREEVSVLDSEGYMKIPEPIDICTFDDYWLF